MACVNVWAGPVTNHAYADPPEIDNSTESLIELQLAPGSNHAIRPSRIIKDYQRSRGAKGRDEIPIIQRRLILVVAVNKDKFS